MHNDDDPMTHEQLLYKFLPNIAMRHHESRCTSATQYRNRRVGFGLGGPWHGVVAMAAGRQNEQFRSVAHTTKIERKMLHAV